jgi:hypothetical protein
MNGQKARQFLLLAALITAVPSALAAGALSLLFHPSTLSVVICCGVGFLVGCKAGCHLFRFRETNAETPEQPSETPQQPPTDSGSINLTERTNTMARSQSLKTITVGKGDTIPCDGRIISGLAMVDEAAMSGVSTPAMLEANSDRDTVIAGGVILEGELTIECDEPPATKFDGRQAMIDRFFAHR